MTTEIAQFMRKLERSWDEHVEALVTRRSVDAALSQLANAPSVKHLPMLTGAEGEVALGRFYRETLLPHLPSELAWTRTARVVDRFRLVDELTVSFVHDRELPWLLPGVEATGRSVSVTAVVIVGFDRGAIASVRTHWDLASLTQQLGLSG